MDTISGGVLPALTAAPLPTADMDLSGGWSTLTGFFPSGVWNILSAIGVLLIVVSFLYWLYKRRKGAGEKFPWIAFILGAVLAGPRLLIPILLTITEGVMQLLAKAFEWFGNQL